MPPQRLLPSLVLIALALSATAEKGFAQAPTLGAPSPALELATKFNEAMSAFQAGDYAAAAAKLESIVSKAPVDAPIESVYFTLGASYFNLEQYDKAAATLKKYLQLYPSGARILEATFSLGQASVITKDYHEAAAQFSKLFAVPQFREQALFYGAVALKEDRRPEEAVAALETLISPEIRSELGLKGALLLVGLYGEKKQLAKVNHLLGRILQKSEFIVNLRQLNTMALELGDNSLQEGRPTEALAAYRLVRTREQIARFQAERVKTLERKYVRLQAAMQANPKEALQYMGLLREIKDDITEARKLAEEAKQLPEFMPGIMLRIGRTYHDMGKRWESLVAYQELARRYPEAKEAETALYGSMVNFAESNHPESAQKMGDQYLKAYPQGTNAETVGYLMGATALQANDPKGAETYFGRTLQEQPDSTYKAEMVFLLGNAKFAQGKFVEAIADYEQYHREFANGTHREDAAYRIAVGLVFAGQYEKALPALESYLQQFPSGSYVPDVRYRLALCYYAASQYDDTIARCRDWEKDFSNDPQLGEVLALTADSLMAKGETATAVETYVRSYKAATTEEVLSYSLFEAQKGFQKLGDWTRMSAMFEEFVQQHGEHPLVPMAMFWIGKAKVRAGQTEEAKAFFADTIKRYLDDAKQEAVEQLLPQLVQLCVKKNRATLPPTPAPAQSQVNVASAPATAAPAPTPESDPEQQLQNLLSSARPQSPTALARILFARAELAGLRRKPDEQKQHLLSIANTFQPEQLSPTLLARVGDVLLESRELTKAEPLFQYLLETYPKSTVADFASCGLGEIAYQKGDYAKALRLFSSPIEAGNANQKLKELTLGCARSLLALDKLDEAQKHFEEVASVREWRGEATAQAVYSLGEIEFKRGKWAEANAYYQRVFVAYQKFLPWVARAYLRSGECFQTLGKPQEATRTYQEMLRNEKLTDFEQTAEARERLQTLTAERQG